MRALNGILADVSQGGQEVRISGGQEVFRVFRVLGPPRAQRSLKGPTPFSLFIKRGGGASSALGFKHIYPPTAA